MSPAAAKVRAAALAPPEDERVKLGHEPLGDGPTGEEAHTDGGEIERAWAPSLEQRAAGMADGSIRVVPFDDAIADVRAQLRAQREARDR